METYQDQETAPRIKYVHDIHSYTQSFVSKKKNVTIVPDVNDATNHHVLFSSVQKTWKLIKTKKQLRKSRLFIIFNEHGTCMRIITEQF